MSMQSLRKLMSGLVAACAVAVPVVVSAQTTTACGEGVKAEVIKAVDAAASLSEGEQLKVEAQLYDKYKSCGTIDAAQVPAADPIFTAARQCGAKVSILGSLFYEEMSCCGYDPQRRTFACPVKVKQRFGFGGSPLPGSREHVLHLEIHLGYQHRGVESRLLERDARSLAPWVETIAGDTTIGHAWAYAAAIEKLVGHEAAPGHELARAVMLELERVAMHLAGLAGMAADVGFLPGASTYGRLRTTAINSSMRLCGSRFGRGAVRPGGSGVTLDDDEPKVTLCHRTGNGSYHSITVSVNAEPAHRQHGDAKIGEPVPNQPGKIFGPDCRVQ